MDGNLVGLAAVVMSLGIPMAAMYTFFRVKKLRSEERMAAIARGVEIPMQPELSESARSRRSGILLVAGAIGYITTFVLIGSSRCDDRGHVWDHSPGGRHWLFCGSRADSAGCENLTYEPVMNLCCAPVKGTTLSRP